MKILNVSTSATAMTYFANNTIGMLMGARISNQMDDITIHLEEEIHLIHVNSCWSLFQIVVQQSEFPSLSIVYTFKNSNEQGTISEQTHCNFGCNSVEITLSVILWENCRKGTHTKHF